VTIKNKKHFEYLTDERWKEATKFIEKSEFEKANEVIQKIMKDHNR